MIKQNGNGTVIIKMWAVVIGLIITCVSLGFNVAHIVGIQAVQDKIYAVECRLDNNEKDIKDNREFFHKLDKDIAEIKMMLKK